MGKEPAEIQKLNLLAEGDEFPFGQKTFNCNAGRCFDELNKRYPIENILNEIDKFNSRNRLVKKGAAVIPICFGISFTTSFLNQASALVHIYTDGSVSISSAAVEMGQGVNAKLKRIAARSLNVDESRIKIESTNTSRVSNTSPTAASKGTDLNGFAVIDACNILTERLKKVAAEELDEREISLISFRNEKVFYEGEPTTLTFTEIVKKAYIKRISLTAQAHHSTPEIHFDTGTNKGHPFAYHVYGSAIVQATLDCLRGIYEFDSVKVVHDFGESFHPVIDLGQAEGGIIQGIGWLTCEELKWNEEGTLLTDALSTYKIPDIYSLPKEMKIHFLENSPNDFGPLRSKAVGEPPFMYGIGAYFALLNAMKAFKPETDFTYSAPLTPEKILLALYKNPKN
jgi:xanthine dehydrogenase large subunit